MSTITTLAFALWSTSGLVALCLGMIALYGVLVLCVVLAAGHLPETPKRIATPSPLGKPRKSVRPAPTGAYIAPKIAKLSPY